MPSGATNGGGEIRGQLIGPSEQLYVATLSANQEAARTPEITVSTPGFGVREGALVLAAGKLKLRNGNTFSLRAVSVFRAQRKNNVTVEVSTDGGSDQKKFIDREYLLLNAGSLDKKSELVVAVSCPVFP